MSQTKWIERPPSDHVYNAGVLCDVNVGPCACGAWHKELFDVGIPKPIPPVEEEIEMPPVEVPDKTIPMIFDPPLAGATFSPCSTWRYLLWRRFKEVGKTVMFLALNPSYAGTDIDDPTVGRWIYFCKQWDAALMLVVNLDAWVATDPKDLRQARKNGADVEGPDNMEHILSAFNQCDFCVVCYGTGGKNYDVGVETVMRLVRINPGKLFCFGLTKHGSPKHVLYLKNSTTLVPFKPNGEVEVEIE